jgi:hypothetical protein
LSAKPGKSAGIRIDISQCRHQQPAFEGFKAKPHRRVVREPPWPATLSDANVQGSLWMPVPVPDLAFSAIGIDIAETGRQKPARIERTRHRSAPGLCRRNRAAHNRADRPTSRTIGLPDFLRRRQCDAHQFAANAEILVRRANSQRAKQISGVAPAKTGVIRTDAMVSPRSVATKESRRSCGPCSRPVRTSGQTVPGRMLLR